MGRGEGRWSFPPASDDGDDDFGDVFLGLLAKLFLGGGHTRSDTLAWSQANRPTLQRAWRTSPRRSLQLLKDPLGWRASIKDDMMTG
eukprot:455490-Pyramimonas_sp.AAC.1